MRRLTAVLLAGCLPFTAVAQDAASEATRTAQAEIAERLPLDDPRDEANVLRGKLAEIPGGVILSKDGKTVWDRRPYAFLDAKDAPDTVNPSLWRQARLNAVHGLFEVVPGKIWQLRGYDISVMTIIRGKTGWIVVDPLLSEEAAAAGWKLFADTVEAKSGNAAGQGGDLQPQPQRPFRRGRRHRHPRAGEDNRRSALSRRTAFRRKRHRKMSSRAPRWGGARCTCSGRSWRPARRDRSTPGWDPGCRRGRSVIWNRPRPWAKRAAR